MFFETSGRAKYLMVANVTGKTLLIKPKSVFIYYLSSLSVARVSSKIIFDAKLVGCLLEPLTSHVYGGG